MSPALAQRQIALAGAGLLAILVALAIGAAARGEGSGGAPASAPAPETGWYDALAAPYSFPATAKRTACGLPAGPKTLGVAHPVLPCGAKIVLELDGRRILTQVVDRGSGLPGRDFDVTASLARRLGLRGVQRVEWRFARPAS